MAGINRLEDFNGNCYMQSMRRIWGTILPVWWNASVNDGKSVGENGFGVGWGLKDMRSVGASLQRGGYGTLAQPTRQRCEG